MKSFSDFKIEASKRGIPGEKIKMEKILNCPVIIHEYRIEDSDYRDKGNGKCLYLGVEWKGERWIVFTGSVGLQDTIKQVNNEYFPFKSTIVKEDERYKFT